MNKPANDEIKSAQRLELEQYPLVERHPAIYQVVPEFDFADPVFDPIEVAYYLADTMLAEQALGLSANQLGLPVRAFVVASNPIICAFNPRIVDQSEDKVKLDEGCLSFRNMVLNIERPEVIKVRYAEPNGNIVTRQFQGMTARIFQHELDHLNGIPFTKHVSQLKLDAAITKKKKIDRQLSLAAKARAIEV